MVYHFFMIPQLLAAASLMLSSTTVNYSPRDSLVGFAGDGQHEISDTVINYWKSPVLTHPFYSTEGNQLVNDPFVDSTGTAFWFVNGIGPQHTGLAGATEVTGIGYTQNRQDGLGTSMPAVEGQASSFFQRAFWHHLRTLLTGRPMGSMHWYTPNTDAILQNEKPLLRYQLDFLHSRSPRQDSSYWKIENEPNLFPSITPYEYANLFAGYVHYVRDSLGNQEAVFGSSMMLNDLLLPAVHGVMDEGVGVGTAAAGVAMLGTIVTTLAAAQVAEGVPLAGEVMAAALDIAAGLEAISSPFIVGATYKALRDTKNCEVQRLGMTGSGTSSDQPTVQIGRASC